MSAPGRRRPHVMYPGQSPISLLRLTERAPRARKVHASRVANISIVADNAIRSDGAKGAVVMRTISQRVAPGAVDVAVAQRALGRIKSYLASPAAQGEQVTVLGEIGDDGPLVLPKPAVELFAFILAAMAKGQGVQLVPVNAVLTTQQAADMMHVSRPYLISLLERGEIAYSLVGRHRRIKFDDLVRYMNEEDQRRKQAADELTRMDEALGDD